jgi:hypothetical protein
MHLKRQHPNDPYVEFSNPAEGRLGENVLEANSETAVDYGSPTKSRLTNARPQNRSLITDKIAPTNARLTYARALTKWRHQQTVARASMYADPLT